MADKSMQSNRIIGMIQPKKTGELRNQTYIKLDVQEKLPVLMKQKMEDNL